MRGITIIEILTVIGIMIVLLAAVTPVFRQLKISATLNYETDQLEQTLRLGRQRGLAGLRGVGHGVYLETNAGADRYILYQGVDFAGRNANYDRVFVLDKSLNLQFVDLALINNDDVDLKFAAGSGQLSDVGQIILRDNSGQQKIITVNPSGLIESD